MRTVLNIIWLILAGLWLFLAYVLAGILLCIPIITIPWAIASFRTANYALWPFGRTIVAKPSAGVGSFRREGTLRKCLKEAEQLVERTKRQGDGGLTRAEAAQARAATDRLARVEAALAELPAVAAAKGRTASKRKGGVPKEARVSTTDPQARVMKMADGGYRPALNVQLATDTGTQIITGVDVTNSGGDQGKLLPMVEQHKDRYEKAPDEMLVDGGYANMLMNLVPRPGFE